MRYDGCVRIAVLLSVSALGLGCSLERTPLFGPELDVGVELLDADMALDAPRPGLDAPMPELDTGGSDAGEMRVDAGPACSGAEPRCEGETLVTCTGGLLMRDDCASRASYCDGTACVPLACVPGSVACAGAMESRCDARGSAAATTACTRGCTEGVGCNATTACGLAIAASMGVGTMRVDTCGQGNDSVHNTGCTRTDRTGSDLIVRLEVPTRANYRIELRVMDPADAVLYLRRACADGASQLACDDDAAAGFGSRIDITLDPGDYFLMLDSFRDSEGPDGRCGPMDLVVELR